MRVRLILENSTVCLIVDELVCFALLTVLVVLSFVGGGAGVVDGFFDDDSDSCFVSVVLSGDVALFSSCWPFGLVWGFVFRWRV